MASVVLVEDNLDHQRVITRVLDRLGHDVTVAGDGRAGLQKVEEQRPDLLIADVDLPELDGLQLCRAIRDDPALADLPVLLVTALLGPGDERLATCGATAVLPKPFGVRQLVDAVTAALPAAVPAELAEAVASGRPAFTEALLQGLDVGVVACDATGRLVVFNEYLRRLFGDEGESVRLTDWPFVLRQPDGTALTLAELPLSRALAGESVEQAGLMAYDLSNEPHWFAVNAHPVRSPAGVMLGAVAVVHDITGEHRSRQYQECIGKVLAVLADTPDTSTAASQILHAIGTTLEWPYMRLWTVDPSADRLRPMATFTAAGQHPLPRPDGIQRGEGLAGTCWQRAELLWVPDIRAADSPVLPQIAAASPYGAAGAVPLRSGDTVTGVMSFFSYARREPEPALATLLTGIAGNIGAYLQHRRAGELAVQLGATTDNYIALVGHELRTPLTSIGACAELIADEPDTTTLAEVRDLIDAITRSNNQLRNLVDHLLDLAALEAGHARLALTTVDLSAVVADVVAARQSACRQRTITVSTDLPAHLFVPGDPHRLHQVVDHLLANAINYSPDDSTITISAIVDHDSAVLTIADNGTGIPSDEQTAVFQRLYRGRNARHSGIPGSGLGLSLTKAILRQHNGTITLTSTASTGTRATIRLPCH